MAHALLSNEGHTLVNGLFRPCNDDASFHDVPHGRCGRRFTLENNIPRIVPFGDNANELVAFHHYQRSNVFFSHFRDGIEDRSSRVNSRLLFSSPSVRLGPHQCGWTHAFSEGQRTLILQGGFVPPVWNLIFSRTRLWD